MTNLSKASLHALLATAAVVFAAPGGAAVFRVQAGTEASCSSPTIDVTGSQGFGKQIACSGPVGNLTGEANAGFGTVGAVARAGSTSAASIPAIVFTIGEFRDTVIFTSTNPNLTSTSARLNIHLSGLFSNSGFTGGTVEGGGSGAGSQFGFALGQGSTPTSLRGLEFVSGVLNAPAGQTDARLRTFTTQVPIGVPVDISFSLKARAFSVGLAPNGLSNFAIADFGSTFEIPLGSDAFELEDGVTANSGTWLVNNRRVDPNAGPGGVPEPASWAMLIMGFGLTGAAMRRRTHKSVAA